MSQRLSPEARMQRRVLRFLARLRQLKATAARRHLFLHWNAEAKDYVCPAGCPVGRVERERKRLAEMLSSSSASSGDERMTM